MKLNQPIPLEKRDQLKAHKAKLGELIDSYHQQDAVVGKLTNDLNEAHQIITSSEGKIDLSEKEAADLARSERAARILPASIEKEAGLLQRINKDISRQTHAASDLVKEIAFEPLLQQLRSEFVELAGKFFKDEWTARVHAKQTEANRLLVHAFTYPEHRGNLIEVTLNAVSAILEGKDIFDPYVAARQGAGG